MSGIRQSNRQIDRKLDNLNPVMGRPTKLTDDRTSMIAGALRAGVPVRWACDAAQIHPTTYYDWMARGEEWMDTDLEDIPEEHRPFAAFSNKMRRARATGLAEPVTELYNMIRNGNLDPAVRLRAIQFFLTHADREHWHPYHLHGDEEQVEGDIVVEMSWPT